MKDKFNLPTDHYFLSHSVGCLPKRAEKALKEMLFEPWATMGGDAWPQWLGHLDEFHSEIAKLMNAPSKQVCAQANLSSGLTKLLTGLPNKHIKGKKTNEKNKWAKRTVLMHKDAFPSLGFVVTALKEYGFELKLIDGDTDGELETGCTTESFSQPNPAQDLQTWENALTEKIDICLITHVHSNTGRVSPVEQICKLCKERDIISIVDIAQSAGIVEVNAATWQADAIIGSCVKWLCGGPGAGFIWVNQPLLAELDVKDVGWFSHQNPFEFDIRHFTPAHDAQKLMGGTPSIAPFCIAKTSVELINDIGLKRIYAHNKALQSYLLEQLHTQVVCTTSLGQIGGTLCLKVEPSSLADLQQNLAQHNIQYDFRKNTIRLSFHLYNQHKDLESLINCLQNTRETLVL